MFQTTAHKSKTRSALSILEIMYHTIVRDIRKSHRNALIGLLLNMMQAFIFILVFFAMFEIMGMRGAALRGDFLLYIMSGIFLFLTHTKAMAAVVSAEGPTSPMMQHAPMNTAIAITAAAVSSLYLQVLSLLVILFIYHVAVTPVYIDNPAGAFGMVLLAWFTGVGVGMVFLSLKPWLPDVVGLLTSLYARANMIASGKMFVANTLPGTMLALFDWNPLFHAIDQNRGFVFINYNPHNSSITYPLFVGITLVMIGLMGEFYTRRHSSISWGAAR